MNLYHLELIDPKAPTYDVADGFVIAAQTEHDARVLASVNSGDEGSEAWMDYHRSTALLIGTAVRDERAIVLRSFSAG